MCDCDCELPKREKWNQVRQEALAAATAVPATGEFLVRDGKVIEVVEVETHDYDEDHLGYLVWVERINGE